MRPTECFKIRIATTEDVDIFNIHQYNTILEIFNDSYISINPTVIEADPFLFVDNQTLFLFYESQKIRKHGVIKMISTKDLKTWTEPTIVLKEPYHLSYPFVFKENGIIYMIPETNQDNSVKLYKASDDSLREFKFEQTLLHQPKQNGITINYSDSSIIKLNGCYYLNTCVQRNGINNSELYFSQNLLGPYILHPASPICISKRYGRNGGSFIQYNNNIYRVSQDCEQRYGDNIHLHKIEELTPTSYKEILFKENVFPSSIDFYKNGGHQFNYASFLGKTVIATDAKEYHKFLISAIAHKLKKIYERTFRK